LPDWWKNKEYQDACHAQGKTYRIKQRNHEKREAAIRAIIVYPMNALVEDQLIRLRKSLDSSDSREWFKDNAKGNRIYFGRYYGNTPIPGHEKLKPERGIQKWDYKRIKRLANKLEQIEKDSIGAENEGGRVAMEDPDLANVIKYSFPVSSNVSK